jgi:hypothetical protein
MVLQHQKHQISYGIATPKTSDTVSYGIATLKTSEREVRSLLSTIAARSGLKIQQNYKKTFIHIFLEKTQAIFSFKKYCFSLL